MRVVHRGCKHSSQRLAQRLNDGIKHSYRHRHSSLHVDNRRSRGKMKEKKLKLEAWTRLEVVGPTKSDLPSVGFRRRSRCQSRKIRHDLCELNLFRS